MKTLSRSAASAFAPGAFPVAAFASAAFLFVLLAGVAPFARAQKLTAVTGPAAAPVSLEDRRAALNAVFHDYWEDQLEHDPEFASAIGDLRYNDKISDYSVAAVNQELEHELNFLTRLAAIDPSGLTDAEQTSRELLLRTLAEDQEAADFKEWEMPVTQMDGIYNTYPELVTDLSFKTVKDYDDWIARLHAIPEAFAQVSANMSIGIEDGRVPPKYLLQKAETQVEAMAGQKPEDSPLALPLKKFPATVPAAEQERIKTEMLAAIGKEDLPAYARFARFLKVSYVPAGRAELGIGALPDGAKYYQFLIRRETTTDLTADQIHQIGLDEVEEGRGRDAGDCPEAGVQGFGRLQGQPEDQSQAEGGLGGCAARRLPRVSDADAGEAALAVRAAAQGALRGGGDAGLYGQDRAAGRLRRGIGGREPPGTVADRHLQRH